jgi:hypothetical protein
MPDPRAAGAENPTTQPVGNAPAAAGMMTPQAPQGQTEAGKLTMFFVQKLLMRATTQFGQNDDGDFALQILSRVVKRFGEHEDTSEEFAPAELKRMLATLAGPGAAGPGAPQTNPSAAAPGGASAPPPGQ